MRLAGAAERFAAISCLAASIPASDPAMKVSVALVPCKYLPTATAGRSRRLYPATNNQMRNRATTGSACSTAVGPAIDLWTAASTLVSRDAILKRNRLHNVQDRLMSSRTVHAARRA